MFLSVSTLLLSTVVLPSIYILWKKLLIWSATRKAGCSSPVKYRHLDPFYGLDLFIKKIKHTQAGDVLALDDSIFAKYGKTVHTLFFGVNHWMTMDPLVVQTVAATEADKFGNEPTNRKSCGPLLGDGTLTVDGALWKRSREVINPIFSRSQLSELSSLKTHVQRFIDLIPTDGSTIDVQPLTKNLFLDTSTEFIFGRSAGSLSKSHS
jgi:cytochrome P450